MFEEWVDSEEKDGNAVLVRINHNEYSFYNI